MFDTTLVYQTETKVLQIKNTGTKKLIINNIEMSSTYFSVADTSVVIPINQSYELPVIFCPKKYGNHSSKFVINNNSFNDPNITIALKGFGDLSKSPQIMSIDDIENDQGGNVRIKFQRSKYDGLDESKKIETYSIWRRISNDNWDAVGMFNAVQDSVYFTTVTTLADSTPNNTNLTYFKISAHTQDPNIYYFSEVDSGYSVDNIAPNVPDRLDIDFVEGNIQLSWNNNFEKDFQYFCVYRSETSNINKDSVYFATTDTIFIDTNLENDKTYYYQISAVDDNGNESEFSKVVYSSVTSNESESNFPTEYKLFSNYPNPFNPSTTIKYSLPTDDFVKLTIFNSLGEEIKVLVNNRQNSGFHKITWNAETNKFADVRKCLLVK
jgi:hypothetical protein